MSTYTPRHGEVVGWKRDRDFLTAQLNFVEQIIMAGKHRAVGRRIGNVDYTKPSTHPRLIGLHEKENPAK